MEADLGTIQPTYPICVAEDDEDDRHLLQLVFSRLWPQCCLCFFEQGEHLLDHLDRAGSKLPVLVILDQNMPGLSGLETLRSLRQRTPPDRLPVVMLTTSTRPEDRDRFLALGGQAFFTKPAAVADWQTVIEAIGRLCNLRPPRLSGQIEPL